MVTSDSSLAALAIGKLRLATWESNVSTGALRWVSNPPEIYASPVAEIDTRARWYALIHPDDRERIRQAVDRALETESGFHEQFHVYGKDGKELLVFSSGQVVRGPDASLRIVGVNLDATDWADALAASEARFQATFEQAAVGIAHVGIDGKWLNVNHRCCEILGYPKEELLQLTFADITHADDLDNDWEFIGELLRGERKTYSLEKRYMSREGDPVWTNLTVSLVRKADGSPDYFIKVIEDTSGRRKAEAERDKLIEDLDRRVRERTADLEKLSFTDPLTSIANRRALDQRLDAEWNRAVRSGEPISLLLIDLDHFKGLNDTLGHGAADSALIAVAAELNRVAHRTADLAARYGGDELAVVLPGTAPEGAHRVAKQIQAAIRSLNLANPGSKVATILTVSQGVATAWPSQKGSCSNLLLAADHALLSAKQNGKNRIAQAPSPKTPLERGRISRPKDHASSRNL